MGFSDYLDEAKNLNETDANVIRKDVSVILDAINKNLGKNIEKSTGTDWEDRSSKGKNALVGIVFAKPARVKNWMQMLLDAVVNAKGIQVVDTTEFYVGEGGSITVVLSGRKYDVVIPMSYKNEVSISIHNHTAI